MVEAVHVIVNVLPAVTAVEMGLRVKAETRGRASARVLDNQGVGDDEQPKVQGPT